MQAAPQTQSQVALRSRTILDASLVIVAYNNRPYLADLCAALRLADPAPREIILVDNASNDGSADFVADHYPEIRTLRLPENLGFACANNQAAALAKGKYLIFLNPDTRPDPAALGALVEALESHPKCGLVTAKILLLSQPNRLNTCGNDIHLTGITLCRGAGRTAGEYTQGETVNAVSGAAFAISRSLFEQLGGFDPNYFMYMEDTDLSLRARLAGWACRCVPEALVFHDYRLRFGPRKTYFQERNRYLMLLKHHRVGTLLLLLPVLLLAEIVAWGFVLLREPDRWRNKIDACTWIWRRRREIARSRAHVQSLRQVSDRHLILQHSYHLDFAQAGHSPVARAAALVFNPLFAVLKALLFALLWW